jgi:isopentenyl-diphosphate delta-isomerase
MSKVTPTAERKADHIRVNLEEDVQSQLTTGLEMVHFEHNALPELKLESIDTSLTFLGKQLNAPILISSMTGGTSRAEQINLTLARGAQAEGVAMGLGSIRAAVEDKSLAPTFQVRRVAPDILLFANLGAVQLNYGYSVDECHRAVEMVEADALYLHFNALQEALQPEGDTDFEDLLPKIERVCKGLDVPVLAKEVGWGISGAVARRLVDAGVTGIDVAGAGGTSWSQVEMHRAQNQRQAMLAGAFVDWGIPTAVALDQVRTELPEIPLIASGGLRSGIDIAKCIAMGADMGGMASPFLKAADVSDDSLVAEIQDTRLEIRACMFATGSADLPALRRAPLLSRP